MRPRLSPYLLPLVLTLGVLVLHLERASLLNGNQGPVLRVAEAERVAVIRQFVELHESSPSSAPMTSWLVRGVQRLLGGDLWWSFVLTGFALLFFAGMALHRASGPCGEASPEPALTQLLFYGSFSNLFVYFVPVRGYDEPLQLTCLFLALCVWRKRPVSVALLLSLATMAAQSTLLLLPGWVAFMYVYQPRPVRDFLPTLWPVAVPVTVYSAHALLSPGAATASALMGWGFNFQSPAHSLESILSVFLAFGPVGCLALWRGLSVRRRASPVERAAAVAAAVAFSINTPWVLLFAQAREARLLALPLVFLWPLAGHAAVDMARRVAHRHPGARTKLAVAGALLTFVGCYLAFCPVVARVYQATCDGYYAGYQRYLAALLAAIAAVLVWVVIARLHEGELDNKSADMMPAMHDVS